jgi:4-diphosphocytidyl-2C-methyl-D-erythritol kinase
MYNSFRTVDFNYNTDFDLEEINDQDSGNDFENILKKNEPEFLSIINILEDFEDVVFSRLTGSGSCIYSVFEKKEHAVNAQKNFQQSFSNLWTHVSENNLINLF